MGTEGIDREVKSKCCVFPQKIEKRFQGPVMPLRSKVRTGNVLWVSHQSL